MELAVSCQSTFFSIHNFMVLILKHGLSEYRGRHSSNHNVPRSLTQKSFRMEPNVCISKYGSVEESFVTNSHFVFSLGIYSVSRFHSFIMFIVFAAN